MTTTPTITVPAGALGAPAGAVVVLDSRADDAVLERFDAVIAAANALPNDVTDYRRLCDATITQLMLKQVELRDAIASRGVLLGGEVAHRSRPELGLQGLAQRNGFGNAKKMLQQVGRETPTDAATTITLGVMMGEAADAGSVDEATGEVSTPSEPWLAPLVHALRAGDLSPDAADSIRRGLGSPNSAVTAAQLLELATELCETGVLLDPDTLFKRARSRRDELDIAGVKLREEELYLKRGLKHFPLPGGGGRAIWDMDIESYAVFKERYDRMTSPKLGGVSFVDEGRKARSDQILADSRTPQQLASDDFFELLRLGEAAEPDFLLGDGTSQLRLTTVKENLETRDGVGRIDGTDVPVSIDTVERHSCDSTTDEVVFDEHLNPLDFGRLERFFTIQQKIILAVMFGGCAMPGCGKPPSWCEAHHVYFWKRDDGTTDIGFGILLCRHHHRMLHNNGWEIALDKTADGDRRFAFIPPTDVDPHQIPIPAVPINNNTHDLKIAFAKAKAARQAKRAA